MGINSVGHVSNNFAVRRLLSLVTTRSHQLVVLDHTGMQQAIVARAAHGEIELRSIDRSLVRVFVFVLDSLLIIILSPCLFFGFRSSIVAHHWVLVSLSRDSDDPITICGCYESW
jgi:hypothetical protein